MKTLKDLAPDDFTSLIGDAFDLDGHTLTLRKVDTLEAPHPSLPIPISLVFSGPEDLIVAGLHTLSHDKIGTHELLVHRVVDPGGPTFEIVFG